MSIWRSMLSVALAALLWTQAPATAQDGDVPRLLSYQGQLVVDGQPINEQQTIVFELYDQPDGGSPLEGWREERTVVPQHGVFSVLLGEQNELPASVFEEHGTVYLAISTSEVDVRVPLTAAPFAFRARYADRAGEVEGVGDISVSADMLQDGAVTSSALADGVAVRELNGLTESVELVAGSNVSISTNTSARRIEISAEGGNGGLSSVNTDNTLVGDGTSGNALGLADGATVRSLNGLADAVTLEAGDNVSLDVQGSSIVISAEGAGNGGAENGANAGVQALNDLTGEVQIVGGQQIEVELDGQDIVINRVAAGPPSSVRYKENIEPILDPLSVVQQLEGVRFTWKEDNRADIGLLAEDVEDVLPELVHHLDDGQVEGVRYENMVALLIEAVKEQSDTILTLEERLEQQEQSIEYLTRLVEELQDAYRR